MSDIAASEQRLIAALDRIDRSLDAGAARRTDTIPPPQAPQDDAALSAAQAEIARLTAELSALREVRAADVAQMEAMLATIEGLLADDPRVAAAPADAAPDTALSETEGR